MREKRSTKSPYTDTLIFHTRATAMSLSDRTYHAILVLGPAGCGKSHFIHAHKERKHAHVHADLPGWTAHLLNVNVDACWVESRETREYWRARPMTALLFNMVVWWDEGYVASSPLPDAIINRERKPAEWRAFWGE